MCFREKIKDGYFNKVRNNKSEFKSHITHSEDCEYVQPIYKWYCFIPFLFISCRKVECSKNETPSI